MRYLTTITCALALVVAGCGGSDDNKKTTSSANNEAAVETALLRDMETFIPADVNKKDKSLHIDQAICKKLSASNYRCTLYEGSKRKAIANAHVSPRGNYSYTTTLL